MVNKKPIPKASFSKIAFSSLLCLTLVTFLGLGWQTWRSYKNVKTFQEQDFRIHGLIGAIMHLDEVLTMSACMGTKTGDFKWEERYLKFEPQLEAAINEAKRLAPAVFILKAAIQTDTANTKLVAMEKRAFGLVHQGQREEASAILFSEEYQRQKQIFAEGMEQVRASMQDHITDALNEYRRHEFFTILTILTVLPAMFFAFIYIIILTRRRYVIERTLSEDKLEKYGILFDNISDLVYICDTERNVLFINRIFEKLSGRKPEEFTGKSFAPALDGDNLKKVIDLYSRTLNGESPQQEICFKDTGILCEYKNMPLRDERGKITGVIGIARDITERKRLEDELKESNKTLEQRVTERTKEIAETNKDLQIKIAERKQAEEILRESEAKYGRLIENLHENHFFYSHDTKGMFTYISPSITKILGYSPGEFLTHYSEYMTDNPMNKEVIRHTGLSISGIKQPPYEVELYHKDGSIKTLKVQEVPVFDKSRKVTAVEGLAEDITLRRQSEEQLRKLSSVVEQSPITVVITDTKGRIEYVNPKFTRLTDYTSEEAIGKNPRILKSGKTSPETYRQLWKTIKSGGEWHGEFCNKKKNGKLYWESASVSPIRNNEGIVTHFVAVKEDITEHKHADEKLAKYQTQLKRLSSALSLTEERERRQISEDLHDRIGQTLTVIKMKLENIQEPQTDTDTGRILNETWELLDKTIKDLRTLTFEISPPVLYELGFGLALEWLVERFKGRHNISIDFVSNGLDVKLNDDISFFLFKSVRELLFNVIKHARAHKIKVTLLKNDNKIRIDIDDDGIGFDFSNAQFSVDKLSGFGLFSIRERMEHFGGNLDIKSKPGQGACLTLTIPLKQQEGDTGAK